MEIHNATEFRNFVNMNGLRNLHADIANAANCVLDIERGCNCWKQEQRQVIINNCNVLYQKAVAQACGPFAHQFSSHNSDRLLVFSLNGSVIGSVRR